jgi:hypothetical protein
MRDQARVRELAREMRRLAAWGDAEKLPSVTVSQGQAMRKAAEALDWACGDNNGLENVINAWKGSEN